MNQVSEAISDYITRDILHRSGSEGLDPELNLLQEGVLDSLGLRMLVAFLEENFSISINDDDLLPENFETIFSISALVSGHQP